MKLLCVSAVLFLLRHVLRAARHSVFPGTPAGIHAERCALQNGLDLMDFAFLDFEHFGELPRPGIGRTASDTASIGRFEISFRSERMIEEGETENEAAL